MTGVTRLDNEKNIKAETENGFVIWQKLCSQNDVVAANRTNKYVGAKLKTDIEKAIGWDIKKAVLAKFLKPVVNPCIIEIDWHEAIKRRDVDNIQSSQKFILDAMVKNKILPNDNSRYVRQIYHNIVDDDTDYVVVRIKEI